MENLQFGQKPFVEGEPCGHPGCMSHRSHPCEKCGRIQGRDRTGLAQAKMMAGQAAEKSHYVVHFNTEVIRKDGSKVFIHEVLPLAPKRKCPGYTVNLGDQRGICIHCGAPAGAH